MKDKIKTEKAKNGKWSDWIFPKMTGYNMGCCDCNLFHTINFKVVKVHKIKIKKGKEECLISDLPKKDYNVMFKVCRNNKLTKSERAKLNA
jgi:hypothetical protein